MKKIVMSIILFALIYCAAYASFSQFVRVAPGIEKEHPSMPYSINTTPVLKISSIDQGTLLLKIPFLGTRQTSQKYWKIVCTSPLKENQLNFRDYVWEYEDRKGWIQMIKDHEKLSKAAKAELIKKHGALKSRSDVEEIELLNKGNSNIAIKIPKSEIERTYIYRDYPSMVMDGGYYYCFDLPAYYKQLQAEQGD